MESQIINKAIEQAPSLVVLAFIVWLFIKHLRGYNGLLRDINRENLDAREESRLVIKENTRAVAENTAILRSFNQPNRESKRYPHTP